MKVKAYFTKKEGVMLWLMYSTFFALGCWYGWDRNWDNIIFTGALVGICLIFIIISGSKDEQKES